MSSESVMVTPCSCFNETLIGLHFVAQFRILHVALKSLLFLASRATKYCFLVILKSRVIFIFNKQGFIVLFFGSS